MKLSVITMLICLTIFSSCSKDDDNINDVLLTEAEIPTAIKSYIETHFPSNTIVRAEKDTENNTITYEIYLNDNINLEFNSTSEIIDIDGVIQLPNSVIPESILDYVSTNYPNNFITDWELEFNHQQVELNNNLELEFEMNGNFIRIDND
ncbi:PepSY-like domain-containing protein [Mesonia hippocampi]|uniref:PepSY-like domain-containing protein n=1 Tax=Mesonia hippocampi TaxID=1628250 RepID=UPI003F9EA091